MGCNLAETCALLAESNNLAGSIPDNFDATSHLRVFVAWNNALTGSIPLTLGLVPNLEVSSLEFLSCRFSKMQGKRCLMGGSYHGLSR